MPGYEMWLGIKIMIFENCFSNESGSASKDYNSS